MDEVKSHRLKFAWSFVCGIACGMLIALWVRSYWRADTLTTNISATRALSATSQWGRTSLSMETWSGAETPATGFSSLPANRVGHSMAHRRGHKQLDVQLPHYTLVVLLAAAAAVPWIRRFSVRTLLIAMAVLAVLLAILGASK